jgi:hypothetical protein
VPLYHRRDHQPSVDPLELQATVPEYMISDANVFTFVVAVESLKRNIYRVVSVAGSVRRRRFPG